LPQVFDVTDRIFVLRHGLHAGTVRTTDTDMEQVIKLISGATLHEHRAAS
jgi:ABC-type sugar transport system ATPase subunit